MADPETHTASAPAPPVTYKNPRRTSPENSITLRHHRLARDASKVKAAAANAKRPMPKSPSPRRQSSDESNETGLSDPKQWFDRSNENRDAVVDSMDVDPPFFQRESDSSNEEGAKYALPSQSPAYNFLQSRNQGLLRPGLTHSSSADDYRSVIDDLTIENKRLKEELKRYKQMGPDSLRREKLFEVKVHGLPPRKKRELEAALRDFTASLDGSSVGASSTRKKDKHKGNLASSSSGSNNRPGATDSAYASMSTIGPSNSSVPSLPGRSIRQRTDQAVERFLQDVPEGLWPRHNLMSEKDRKKLVVRRLEKLFTGQGPSDIRQQLVPPAISEDVKMSTPGDRLSASIPPSLPEASREAQILPRSRRKNSHSRDNGSASNSNGDQTDSRDNGNGSGSGAGSGNGGQNDTSVPEQRPTRPRDLDPDRIQVPSENMDYIRHLGLVAPQEGLQFSAKDVSPDAEGWVYLNLLCNLAQLHMLNVTPAFIRAAVSEKSKLFQLSPDGRKIRWRGGAEGTKFSSENSGGSGTNSQPGTSSDDTDGSNDQDQRKKQKTEQSAGNDVIVSEPSKFGPQMSSSSDSFHYKPLFVHQQTSSSDEQPSLGDESGSSLDPPEESNLGMNSRWNHSGVSGVSQRKRRRDGAIIYYTGAPFCTDLSGDLGEISPDSYNSTSLDKPAPVGLNVSGAALNRTTSGSSIPFKPLSNYVSHRAMMDLDFVPPESTPDETDETDDIVDADFPWSDASTQSTTLTNLEASGLGGITPDDHFVVTVSTRRPKSHSDMKLRPTLREHPSQETAVSKDTTDSIAGKLAAMSTSSPIQLQGPADHELYKVEIHYVDGKIKVLPPAPLPPPTFYFGASDGTESEYDSDDSSVGDADDDELSSGQQYPSRAVAVMSGDEDLTSGDEEDEHSDGNGDLGDDSCSNSPNRPEEADDNLDELDMGPPRGQISPRSKVTGSSAATAGDAASGFSSMGDA